ncbi:hypothetical protein [Crocosphaera sp.]|uniref:hypothetical protein n=1 Tax=Crocosphaera sp. TaxID=2729996 RepID=UPI00261ED8D1|nr:hypothetical protein [Crocosphaera sp.]MDJ0579767.1 hypothetical protein [Crocosphaera sp.]
MTTPRDRLYKLLPAIYRLRDADEKEPLRALLGVIEAELDIVENDIGHLYQNWFIETCDDWIVPYIADLLDVREVYNQTLNDLDQTSYGQREWRALVANTLAYRRRKGTIAVLEQLAKDVTGWRSHAVEFGRLILTSQNLNHVVTQNTLVNLRADNYVQTIGTPFESQAAYSVDIRSPSNGGRYNISQIGLFVWRLQSYPLNKITPRKITPDRYTFNPLGYDDIPLFNQPQTETNLATLTQEINVPDPLSILPLAKELRRRRQLLWEGKYPEGVRYFDSDPILEIFINGQVDPIAPETILICSLDKEKTWEMPNLQRDRLPGDPPIPTPVVAVDPTLGRIKFLDPPYPQQVEVSYSYGFSDDLGGGPYPRQIPDDDPIFEVDHVNSVDSNPLAMAIETWNQKAQVLPGIENKTNIPIVDVTIRGISQRNHEREMFSSGVIRGLSVIKDGGNQQIVVTSGQAIDGLGRIITLSENLTMTLETLRDTIADYPGNTGFLVIFYQSEQQKISIEFVRETAIDALKRYCIPLVQLTIDSRFQQLQELETVERDFNFTPGIVWGLEVKMMANTLEAMVTPGLAIDKKGRKMTLNQSLILNFKPYLENKENLSLILLQINTLLTSRWQIELVTPDEIDEIKKDNRRDYIELAQFNPIAPLEIEVHKRQNLELVTIEGLEVTRIPSPGAIVEISPGTVTISSDKLSDASETEVESEVREIKLENPCRLDLSEYPGQTLTLFISSEKEQGLPLNFVSETSPNIGIVPQIIDSNHIYKDIYKETIVIKDSHTYEGDYEIIIPRKNRLTIIADNGQRPHLQGKIYIRGTAKGEDHQAGELCFEGLLIEGNMIVRSGNLGRLQIRHCTLVPANSQLKVQSRFQLFQEPEENKIDPFNLIGLVISFLTFIYQWISRYLGQNNYHSPYRFSEIFQLYCQQLQSLFTLIEQTFLGESRTRDDEQLELDGGASMFLPLEHDNIHLEIIIERSICGAIFLADTVPKLTIQNSIIDYKNFRDKSEPETGGICLLAEGVHSDIYNSTLLGSTTVKTIEASNSIFSQTLRVLRKQTGCIRFSYVSGTSDTPLRYRCQPDLTFKEQLDSDNLAQKITCLAIGKKIGIGTIYNDPQNSNKIIGSETSFQRELKEEYEINIVRKNQTNEKEMRTIRNIESETGLTINQPLVPPIDEENAAIFEIPFIFAGTLGNGLFNSFNQGKQWNNISENLPDFYITAITSYTQEETTTLLIGTIEGKIYQSQLNNNIDWTENNLEGNNTPISALLTYQNNIWAATTGQGVWTYTKDQQNNQTLGKKWQSITEGLDDLNVTSLAINAQGQLLAGTQEKGVFIYIDEENNKTWSPFNTGLLDLHITVLIVNSQKQLLAGTQKGGVFYYNDNQNKWVEMNENLTHLNITAMVSSQIKSRISIQENIVTGQNTFFKQEGLKPGAKFFQDGEDLGIITQIKSDTKLILQTVIQEDIINQEYKNYELIFAATDDGKLFRYLQGGTAWEKLNLDLKGIAITVLNKVDETGGNLFLGTAAGDIMYSQENGQNWFSMNQGLTNVEQKLTIMASLQPNFTSSFYGDPGYAQLSQNCAIEIRNGGEDGAEMGAFYSLKQPQKEQNLQATLKEYLPFGLQVGTFYIT